MAQRGGEEGDLRAGVEPGRSGRCQPASCQPGSVPGRRSGLAGQRGAQCRQVRPGLVRPLNGSIPHRFGFGQGVGLVFTLGGTIGYITGFTTAAVILTCLALGAAFLNAAFVVCLGCEIYLRLPMRLRQATDVEMP